ncbi:AlpA family phage regulatory protein [Stenotrophomonas sp. S41]|uniref:helix-turn-helix transcriptional regulator n=1 Tax=Stenotrophomonas sp. S41 TaxID=2767464 RepID=UPI001F15824B|nr:AlpA family phage regulatory protein [Stenotrophomonas sp. S41]
MRGRRPFLGTFVPGSEQELLPLDPRAADVRNTFIYGEIKAGRFPRSIRIGRSAVWIRSEVQG